MENKNKSLKIFLYISTWVIVWGSIASLIDFPLLKNGLYSEGEIGQYITFSITALISILGAQKIFKSLKL
mgnify:CR=1 FL=1|tara:strand:+ start:351 stop:560 length:210 start_codon:yes stop_codon:yes gene_type:complete